MPKAARKTAKPAAPAPAESLKIVEIRASALKTAMGLWHKRVNMISGDMTLSYGKTGLKRSTLKGWVTELRALADAMEKHLTGGKDA